MFYLPVEVSISILFFIVLLFDSHSSSFFSCLQFIMGVLDAGPGNQRRN